MPFFLHLIYDFRFRRKADCSEIQIMHCSYFFLEFEGKSPGPILHCKKTTKIQVPGARYKTLTHSSLLGTTCTPEHHLITDVQDTESLRKSSTIIHDKLPPAAPSFSRRWPPLHLPRRPYCILQGSQHTVKTIHHVYRDQNPPGPDHRHHSMPQRLHSVQASPWKQREFRNFHKFQYAAEVKTLHMPYFLLHSHNFAKDS
jgi:hypothetical protein